MPISASQVSASQVSASQVSLDRVPLTLGICDIYHPRIHGNTTSSSSSIDLHYIVNCIVEPRDFIASSNRVNNIEELYHIYECDLDHLTRMYKKIAFTNKYIKHPMIENYDAIIRKDDYIKIDIIETHVLDGMEEIAVLKTHWLRLIQRKWKRLYKIKMEKIKKKISFHYLRRREIGRG